MEFEWHEAKRETNLKKHGIDFRDIPAIWANTVHTEGRYCHGEQRSVAYATLEDRLIVIIYTGRSKQIRLISARSASREEREAYARLAR